MWYCIIISILTVGMSKPELISGKSRSEKQTALLSEMSFLAYDTLGLGPTLPEMSAAIPKTYNGVAPCKQGNTKASESVKRMILMRRIPPLEHRLFYCSVFPTAIIINCIDKSIQHRELASYDDFDISPENCKILTTKGEYQWSHFHLVVRITGRINETINKDLLVSGALTQSGECIKHKPFELPSRKGEGESFDDSVLIYRFSTTIREISDAVILRQVQMNPHILDSDSSEQTHLKFPDLSRLIGVNITRGSFITTRRELADMPRCDSYQMLMEGSGTLTRKSKQGTTVSFNGNQVNDSPISFLMEKGNITSCEGNILMPIEGDTRAIMIEEEEMQSKHNRCQTHEMERALLSIKNDNKGIYVQDAGAAWFLIRGAEMRVALRESEEICCEELPVTLINGKDDLFLKSPSNILSDRCTRRSCNSVPRFYKLLQITDDPLKNLTAAWIRSANRKLTILSNAPSLASRLISRILNGPNLPQNETYSERMSYIAQGFSKMKSALEVSDHHRNDSLASEIEDIRRDTFYNQVGVLAMGVLIVMGFSMATALTVLTCGPRKEPPRSFIDIKRQSSRRAISLFREEADSSEVGESNNAIELISCKYPINHPDSVQVVTESDGARSQI